MQYQTIDIPFAGGVNQKLDAELLQPGMWMLLQDCVLDKPGGLHKRHGFTARSASVSLVSRLSTFENELIRIDGHILWSYEAKNPGWAGRDRIPEALVTTNVVEHVGPGSILWPVVAENLGIRVYARADAFLTNVVRATVIDVPTGAVLIADMVLSAGAVSQPQVVVVGNFIAVTYADGANIYGRTIDCTNPFFFNAEVVISAAYQGTATGTYDTYAFDATSFHMALWDTGGGGRTRIALISSALVMTASVIVAEIPTNSIACRSIDGVLYVAWQNVNGIRCIGKNPTTMGATFAVFTINATVAPISNQITICRKSGTSAGVIWTFKEGATQRAMIAASEVTNAGAVAGVQVNTYSVRLVSKAFEYDGHAMVLAQTSGTTAAYTAQGTYFLLDLGIDNWTTAAQTFRVIASCLQSGASLRQARGLCPVAAVTGAPGQYTIAGQGFSVADGDAIAGSPLGPPPHLLMELSFDLSSGRRWPSVGFGQAQVFAGGVPVGYDGVGTPELGFHLYPEWSTATPAGAGGALPTGTYSAAIVFQWFDARGQRYLSTPQIISSIVVPGAGAGLISFTVPNLNLTNKQSLILGGGILRNQVEVLVYVTQAGDDVYYRIQSTLAFSDPTSSTDIGPILVTTINTATEQLYTQGGALENAAVPPCSIIENHQNRLWLVSGDDAHAIRYSKEMTVGVAPEFNQGLELRIDDGGNIVALASMDDKLVVFKSNAIFYVFGQGATNAGTGDSLNWARIVSESGCNEPRSVALTPEGLVFLGSKGFYLLDRQLGVSYLGAPVEDTVAAFPVCQFATHSTTARRIYFGMALTTGNFPTGVVLVYDYLVKAWYHWYPQLNDLGLADSLTFDSGVVWQGQFHVAVSAHAGRTLPNGAVYFENPASFVDNAGNYIQLRGKTAPIRLAGIQGWQRISKVTFLTKYISDFVFNVDQFNDYPAGFAATQSYTFPVTAPKIPGSTGQVSFAPVAQKCEAMVFDFFDTSPGMITGTGEGYSITGLELVIGAAKGSFRLPAGARL